MIRTSLGESVETYPEYLMTRHWRELRAWILSERGHECEVCYSTERLHVHHKHYRTIGHEHPGDLQVLCETCHFDVHDGWDERRAVREVRDARFAFSLGEYLGRETLPVVVWKHAKKVGAFDHTGMQKQRRRAS